MNKEKIKSKVIYFAALIVMCIILVVVTYVYFLRTINVDVMKDIVLYYTGENGTASVEVINESGDLNKRTQEFLDTVTYEVTPDENLSNGDTIHIVASYDEELASEYHFNVKNAEKDMVVEGLYNRYETLEDIDKDYLNIIYDQAQKYVEKHANDIYELDYEENEAKFVSATPVYKVFLKSATTDISDRILVLYEMTYQYEEEDITLYYTVTIPNINDGREVDLSDIFGEKAYLTDDELNNKNFSSYINRVYGSQFTISEIEEEQETEEDTSETDKTQVDDKKDSE